MAAAVVVAATATPPARAATVAAVPGVGVAMPPRRPALTDTAAVVVERVAPSRADSAQRVVPESSFSGSHALSPLTRSFTRAIQQR